ncbi:diguanylate cyclase [Salinibacterium sp. SYSU T00001]|uniref:sensor domain-containing protein n=1 Tax=Homoserinimonas sedimenticola TaxID=2986805 RepID=UPI00223615FA|nr:diguanylate cyclase [Salinibacterium sedimenticola]MCW4384456.1 diguanylate cyclase [Salinibacterium sedimenticola]
MTSEPISGIDAIETSLADLYENAPSGYLSITLDGVIVRVNDTFLAMSGYTRDQLVGAPLLSLLSPGGRLFFESRFVPTLLLEGDIREVALPLQHASGDPLPILVNGLLVTNDEGRRVAIRMAVFEYSGRKEYERELLNARRKAEASETRLRLLHEAAGRFGAADSDESLAEELAASLRKAFAAREVAVYLREDADSAHLAAGAPLLQAELHAEGGPVEQAMRGERVVTVGGAEELTSWAAEAAGAMRAVRVESVAVVPILGQQKAQGVAVMFFRRTRRFDSDETDLSMTFGRQAAEVLTRLRVERLLERSALYDEVTGLPTRRLIGARVNETIDAARSRKRPMALATVTLDGLKSIYATFGQVAGDEALTEIGARLAHTVRHGDLVGRLREDEFVLICPGVDEESARELVDRLLAALRRPLQAGDGEQTVASNVGVAVYSGVDGARVSSQKLFELAGAAMYRANSAGRNQGSIIAVGESVSL